MSYTEPELGINVGEEGSTESKETSHPWMPRPPVDAEPRALSSKDPRVSTDYENARLL